MLASNRSIFVPIVCVLALSALVACTTPESGATATVQPAGTRTQPLSLTATSTRLPQPIATTVASPPAVFSPTVMPTATTQTPTATPTATPKP